MRLSQLTDAENDWLEHMDPADKAVAFDKLMGAYAVAGHHAAYLCLDALFEQSPLLRPWQRAEAEDRATEIASVVSSQALSGVEIDPKRAGELYDEVAASDPMGGKLGGKNASGA